MLRVKYYNFKGEERVNCLFNAYLRLVKVWNAHEGKYKGMEIEKKYFILSKIVLRQKIRWGGVGFQW